MDECIDSEFSERSSSGLTFSTRDIHAHYDQIFFSNTSIQLTDARPKQDKYLIKVQCNNQTWSIDKSILEFYDLDEQIHNCTFTRKYSNLLSLSSELFDLENRRKGTIEDIKRVIAEYIDKLNVLIEDNIKVLSCLHVLNFLEMNNSGEHTFSACASSSEDQVKTNKSYFSRIKSSFKQNKLKHGKVFGVDLSLHMQKHNEKVPCIVYDCVTFIENHLSRGIYRISSVSSQINQLKELYDEKRTAQFEFDKFTDVNAVACLLKMYFRLLPHRLLNPLPEDVMFMKSESVQDQISDIRLFLNTLEPDHYRTTAFLIRHLKLISDKADSTNMDAANLALVWSPNLFKIKSTKDQITNMNGQNRSVELMIRHYREIFELLSIDHPLEMHQSSDGSYGIITTQEDTDYSNIRNYTGFSPSPKKFKHKRVRSEEPPPKSFMSSFRRNLKVLGNNMKSSFRNLVKVGNTSLASSESGSVEYVSHRPPQMDTMSASLSMQIEKNILHIHRQSGRNSPYASISLKDVKVPKAEMDTFSTDSLPFEASRYDNLENKRPMSG
ncbi:unnamed protein product [Bursaphelenchus okinawaensis]|uniref:Rho-GAP domain-containing protein n=1 Tax=Bursaphelenchus okinawaensis TaxID=465554 RepID=A0A811KLQ7_9BILA|nr:unnamed protein product [Bursaphelenchus okinawaensis]CAG9104803.1 unnamed protein product [Bursaphelenchus okinawaensis]